MIRLLSPWSISDQQVQDDEARQRIADRARELFRAQRRPTMLRRALRALQLVALLLVMLAIVGSAAPVWLILIVLGLLAVVVHGAYWVKRRPFLHQALSDMEEDYCFSCGYRLRGLPKSIVFCPECGIVRVHRISEAEIPRIRRDEA